MEEPDAATDAAISDIVDAVARVRTHLGVGLLESTYKQALARELEKRGRRVLREQRVHVLYDGEPLDGFYCIDLVVDGVVVEVKASHELHPTAFAQTLTYLKATRTKVGLLVNFHAVPLRLGIHRLVRRT